jgi:iron complex outermembrane receptor protein
MFKHISLLLFVLFCINSSNIAQTKKQNFILSGKVTDESTGQALQGASIYFPEFKKGVISAANGSYEITLPQGEHIVEVSFIGFSIYTKTVIVKSNQQENFKLGHSAVENSNITVTSFLHATSSRKTPTPINIIKKEDLFRSASTNFIDALSKTPGVTQLSTGPAVSKPIIRGLGYNRVMVLNDGVRQEGQQWGDEHGIEIDEYNVTRTEVLKVPSSIIYGSEALSGVINVVSNVPVAEGAIRGNVFSNYQSNNKFQGYHFDIAGNKKGFVWGINGSSKSAADYQNKYDGYVYNSKFNELNGGGYVGIEKDWGYTHFFVSQFNQKLGMIEGERDEQGRFIKPASNNFASPAVKLSGYVYMNPVATDADFNATNPQIPYQHIIHTKYTLDNNIKWGEGRLKANIAYQRNERMEYGNIDNPTEKSLYFDLGTLNYSFQYLLPEKNNWKHTIGVNGMQQENKNKGMDVLIPAYQSVELGLFFYTQKRAGKLTMSGGARIDKKGIEFNELANPLMDPYYLYSSTAIPAKQKKDYGDIAGSFGMTYEAGDDLIFKLNIARGYRAPNLSELGSNGAHEGTNRYEYGNTNLKSEKSLQFDLGAEWSSEHVSFAGSVFYNQVTDYIFYQKLLGNSGTDSIIVNADGKEFYAFAYQQQNANLMGAEFNLDIHPHPIDGLHIENTFSYVKGSFAQALDGSKNLPNIPSLRWISECRYEFKNKSQNFKNSYVTMQLDNVATQNDPFTGYHTETKTPGYHLLNVGLGTQYTKKGKQLFSIAFNAQNLTDVAYQNHLSRLKYTAENMATGRMGVYNMGRNFSIKVNVPLFFD